MCDISPRRLKKCIPLLLRNEGFRKLLGTYNEHGGALLEAALAGRHDEKFGCATVLEWVDEIFHNYSETILSAAWDGESMGCSGAILLKALYGVFMVVHTDLGQDGPFASLQEALDSEFFEGCMPDMDLQSDDLGMDVLLGLARKLIDWENAGTVHINGVRYHVVGDNLVRVVRRRGGGKF